MLTSFSKTLHLAVNFPRSPILVLSAALLAAGAMMSAAEVSNPYAQLEAAAGTSSGNGAASVSAVADAVFAIPHHAAFQQLPASARDTLKRMLESAEQSYWNGGGRGGIREQDIVSAVNAVVARLSLPEYARTTQAEVRKLRVKMLFMTPHFMGLRVGISQPDGTVGPLSGPLSPLQAYHLVLTLADQKMVNPEYQVTPAEWSASRNKPSADSAKSLKVFSEANAPRIREMREALASSLTSLSDVDGLELAVQILHGVGIW